MLNTRCFLIKISRYHLEVIIFMDLLLQGDFIMPNGHLVNPRVVAIILLANLGHEVGSFTF